MIYSGARGKMFHEKLEVEILVRLPLREGMVKPWVAGPCLLCVILLETVDGVLTM